MASISLLSLSLCFLVLFHGCLADHTQPSQEQQQQHRVRGRTQCNIDRLSAQEPNRRVESEAGVTEFWDENNEQFDCAGVAACRNIIQPKGLLLPQYTNAPLLVYVVQGRGVLGTAIPGCPETYESEQQSSEGEHRRSRDRHQKVRRFREGDVFALPAGVANWAYNDGEVPLVTVQIADAGNDANQLDQNVRKFLLAGNLRQGTQQQQQQRPGEHESQESRGQREREQRQREESRPQWQRGQEEGGNIFNGFDQQILADCLNVDDELVRRIQGHNDQRGRIVRVEKDLQMVRPRFEEEEEREGERDNGLEETLCTMRLGQNIANPRRADVYNPRGGRITSLNSQKLPILSYLQLSAERGVLYSNAIMAPHWNMNAHSVIYIIRGSGRLQIVNQAGRSAFNDQVREGQLIIVPQNFAVLKKASNQGLEWVSFKTNDNAKTSPMAGRLSALRGMPEEVLMNSYDISREDARSLKYNRQELTVFGPGSRSQRGEYA